MKTKITKIKGKRLIIGNKNEVTKNEILVREVGDKINLYERNSNNELEQIESEKDYSDYRNIDCVTAKLFSYNRNDDTVCENPSAYDDIEGFYIKDRDSDCIVRIPVFVWDHQFNFPENVEYSLWEDYLGHIRASRKLHLVDKKEEKVTHKIPIDKDLIPTPESGDIRIVLYYNAKTKTLTKVPDGKYFINCIPMYVEFRDGKCITERGSVQVLHYQYGEGSSNYLNADVQYGKGTMGSTLGLYPYSKHILNIPKGWLQTSASNKKDDILRRFETVRYMYK